MSIVNLQLRLRCIEDFFAAPDVDPFSAWYEIYQGQPGIEHVLSRVSETPSAEEVRITVRLPADCISPGLALRLQQAIARYCTARRRTVGEALAAERYRNLWMLAFAIVMVVSLVTIAHAISGIRTPGVYIAVEGLSIAAWVLLWHPLENLVFTRWERRLEQRTLTTLTECAVVKIEPLDGDAFPGDGWQCPQTTRGNGCAACTPRPQPPSPHADATNSAPDTHQSST